MGTYLEKESNRNLYLRKITEQIIKSHIHSTICSLRITMALVVAQFMVQNLTTKISGLNMNSPVHYQWQIQDQTQMVRSFLYAQKKPIGK